MAARRAVAADSPVASTAALRAAERQAAATKAAVNPAADLALLAAALDLVASEADLAVLAADSVHRVVARLVAARRPHSARSRRCD